MQNSSLNLIFTGDLCCHNRFSESLAMGKDIISSSLKEFLGQSDGVIYNFEGGSFGDFPVDLEKSNIRNSPLIGTYLNTFSAPVLNLANNHTLDYGPDGLKKTVDSFRTGKLLHFGSGNNPHEATEPVTIIKENIRVNIFGLLAYHQPENFVNGRGIADLACLPLVKKKIHDNNDINILCVHGGEEFTYYPMPYKRMYLQKLASKLNPDVIISHHSHTFQGIEKLGKTLIFHSLGNFMFDYPSHALYEGTQHGMLASLIIGQEGINYSITGIYCNPWEALVDKWDLLQSQDTAERLNLDNYRRKIGQDAYRVAFKSKKDLKVASSNPPINLSFNKWIHRLKLLKAIISDRFLFSLYFTALKFSFVHDRRNN